MIKLSQIDYSVGDRLTLSGKTKKGKNRVRELGQNWTVTRITPTVNFTTSGSGPFLLIEPDVDPEKARWLSSRNDPDFIIL